MSLLKKIARTIIYWPEYKKNIKEDASKKLLMECFVTMKGESFQKNNWGDDLNYYLWPLLSDMEVINFPFSRTFFKSVHYSLIGSIIGFYNLDDTIILGSGIMDPCRKIIGTPRKILSVRGPLTRKCLVEKGFDCPEIYGDPALLIPLVVKANNKRNGNIVFIPNEGTIRLHESVIIELCEKHNWKYLNLMKYEKWMDVIDEITSAKAVISESLHGLIIAEEYGIPSVWVEVVPHPEYWYFKYCDFYESIRKLNQKSIKIFENSGYEEEIKNKIETWQQGEIHIKPLLDVIPFIDEKHRMKLINKAFDKGLL